MFEVTTLACHVHQRDRAVRGVHGHVHASNPRTFHVGRVVHPYHHRKMIAEVIVEVSKFGRHVESSRNGTVQNVEKKRRRETVPTHARLGSIHVSEHEYPSNISDEVGNVQDHRYVVGILSFFIVNLKC